MRDVLQKGHKNSTYIGSVSKNLLKAKDWSIGLSISYAYPGWRWE